MDQIIRHAHALQFSAVLYEIKRDFDTSWFQQSLPVRNMSLNDFAKSLFLMDLTQCEYIDDKS